MQGCVVYQKTPVSIDQATNKGKTKVRNTDGALFYYDNLYKEDGIYFGNSKKISTVDEKRKKEEFQFPIDSDDIKGIYLLNENATNAVTVFGIILTGFGVLLIGLAVVASSL